MSKRTNPTGKFKRFSTWNLNMNKGKDSKRKGVKFVEPAKDERSGKNQKILDRPKTAGIAPPDEELQKFLKEYGNESPVLPPPVKVAKASGNTAATQRDPPPAVPGFEAPSGSAKPAKFSLIKARQMTIMSPPPPSPMPVKEQPSDNVTRRNLEGPPPVEARKGSIPKVAAKKSDPGFGIPLQYGTNDPDAQDWNRVKPGAVPVDIDEAEHPIVKTIFQPNEALIEKESLQRIPTEAPGVAGGPKPIQGDAAFEIQIQELIALVMKKRKELVEKAGGGGVGGGGSARVGSIGGPAVPRGSRKPGQTEREIWKFDDNPKNSTK